MLNLSLLAITFLCLIVGPCLLILLVIGYRKQLRQAREAANRNAGYWAEADAQRQEAELERERLRGVAETYEKLYGQMSNIAKEAIKVGEVKADLPARHRMIDDDSILSADEIG